MADRIIPEEITLPSDNTGWVKFHDPMDLTGEDHQRAMKTVNRDDSDITQSMSVVYSIAEALIKAWHIPYSPKGSGYAAGTVPIPEARPGILAKLRMVDYSQILIVAAPVAKLLNGAADADVDDAGVPGSPTVPSGD